jgi:hypothetical protein
MWYDIFRALPAQLISDKQRANDVSEISEHLHNIN